VASVAVEIAEAVKTELNAEAFGMAFTAERAYLPEYDLQDMSVLTVTVVPKAMDGERVARSAEQVDYQIDVGVQKKLATASVAEIDALMALVQEIADRLRFRRLAEKPDALWVRTQNEPVYSVEHLSQLRQFTSVLTLTYRVAR